LLFIVLLIKFFAMSILLLKISTVQIGVPFRAGLDATPTGDVSIIQMRDTSSPVITAKSLARADVDIKGEHHWVLPGDIVFRSRGLSTTSSIVRDVPQRTIAAAPLMRIRVTATDVVHPEYLNWYLNQRPAQIYFANNAKGTMQMMVDKTTLENLEITVPSLSRQEHVISLSRLVDQEQELMKTLTHKYRQRTNSLLLKLVENA
jgi:restriction endonuclease S subunit